MTRKMEFDNRGNLETNNLEYLISRMKKMLSSVREEKMNFSCNEGKEHSVVRCVVIESKGKLAMTTRII